MGRRVPRVHRALSLPHNATVKGSSLLHSPLPALDPPPPATGKAEAMQREQHGVTHGGEHREHSPAKS